MQMTASRYDCDQRLAEIGYDLRQAIEQLRAVPAVRADSNSTAYRSHVAASQFPLQQRDNVIVRSITKHEDSEFDEKSHGDKQSMFWNIRRMRKHRLHPTGYKRTRPISHDQQAGWLRDQKPQFDADSSNTGEDCYGSGESLDSVIERILESTAPDSTSDEALETTLAASTGQQLHCQPDLIRHSQSSAETTKGTHVTDSVSVTLDVNKRHFVLNCNDSRQPQIGNFNSPVDTNNTAHRHFSTTANNLLGDLAARELDAMTFEDLFEEAVESADDTTQSTLIETIDSSPCQKQYRGEENWEQRLYDHDVHQHCHQYKLQAVSVVNDAQYSRVSRGFAFVEKVNKFPVSKHHKPAEPERDFVDRSRIETEQTGNRKTYKQHTVINASLQAPSNGELKCHQPNGSIKDNGNDKLDLGLEAEINANTSVTVSGGTSSLSRSSSITWDTISVDSLVLMDDESATLRAMYSASTSTAPRLPQRHQPDSISNPPMTVLSDSGKNKMENFQACSTSVVGKNEVEDVNSGLTHNSTIASTVDSPKTDGQENAVNTNSSEQSVCVASKPVMTSCSDDVTVLSDSVTTQTLVLNIKLPRIIKKSTKSSLKLPPFRELHLHREMILSDVTAGEFNEGSRAQKASVPAIEADSSDEVEKIDGQQIADIAVPPNDVIVLQTLRPNELMESLPVETEVEFDNRSATSSLEPIVNQMNGQAELVGVERTEAVRVMRVRGRQPNDFRFEAASLKQLVDETRQAFTMGGACQSVGGTRGVTCQAIETRSADNECPPVIVSDITVDCLLAQPERNSH